MNDNDWPFVNEGQPMKEDDWLALGPEARDWVSAAEFLPCRGYSDRNMQIVFPPLPLFFVKKRPIDSWQGLAHRAFLQRVAKAWSETGVAWAERCSLAFEFEGGMIILRYSARVERLKITEQNNWKAIRRLRKTEGWCV